MSIGISLLVSILICYLYLLYLYRIARLRKEMEQSATSHLVRTKEMVMLLLGIRVEVMILYRKTDIGVISELIVVISEIKPLAQFGNL